MSVNTQFEAQKVLDILVPKIEQYQKEREELIVKRSELLMKVYNNDVIKSNNKWYLSKLFGTFKPKPLYENINDFREPKDLWWWVIESDCTEEEYQLNRRYNWKDDWYLNWLTFAKKVVQLCRESSNGVLVISEDDWKRINK